MNQQHKDDLINEIGALIVSNPPTEGMDWNKLALVVRFGEGSQGIYGFYYDESGEGEPASVNDFTIVEKVAELREAMGESEDRLWHRCLIQIVRDTQRIVFTFEYDDPERWHVSPKTLKSVKEAMRPPDDL